MTVETTQVPFKRPNKPKTTPSKPQAVKQQLQTALKTFVSSSSNVFSLDAEKHAQTFKQRSQNLFSALISLSFSILAILLSLLPTSFKSKVADFISNHRDIFICVVLIPVSTIYDGFWYARRFYQYRIRNSRSATSHMDRVAMIQDQINNVPLGLPMCTARPTWLTMSLKEGVYKKYMANIDVSSLDNVLRVDTDKMIVHVEPNCTMGQITRELVPLGWTMAVVPELDDLTVGGLIMGFGIETSSHKYGLFQHTCTAFEILLPNGQFLRATKDENAELFACIPWSHGTLGFLVGAEIKIIPARQFVHMTYLPCYSLESQVNTFAYASKSSAFDFVEMLTFSKNIGVVMVGKMCDKKDSNALWRKRFVSRPRVNAIGNYYKPWFYKHVAGFISAPQSNDDVQFNLDKLEYLALLFSKDSPEAAINDETIVRMSMERNVTVFSQELIPLRDYYHRHTRSLFWELSDIVPFGNEAWFRYLFGWAFPPHLSLMKLTTTEKLREMYEKAHVVQDMLVPINTLQNALLKFDEELKVYPLWVCPMRLLSPSSTFWGTQLANMDQPLHPLARGNILANEKNYELSCNVPGGLVNPSSAEQLYVDIGAYGVPKAAQWSSIVRKIYGPGKVDITKNDSTEELDPEFHVKVMRRIEKFVRDNHGYQALYADCFQSREEFRQMFDHNLYDQLRDKYGCNGKLPTIYDKISRKARK